MTGPQTTQKTSQVSSLANECVIHLRAEKALLAKFVEHSLRINDSLGKSVFPDNSENLELEKQLAKEAVEISSRRQIIIRKIAENLKIDESNSTIRRLAEFLPDEQAKPLLLERQAILSLHKKIAEMSESNTLLLQQSVDIYHRILQSLAGQSTGASTYSASGQVNSRSPVSVVSTQG